MLLPEKKKQKSVQPPRKERREAAKIEKRKRKKNLIPKVENLKVIENNAAGLDIGSREIFVCVPEGRAEVNVRPFDTFSEDLLKLADWLSECEITTVAMESTGVYWIPIYEILELRGFDVNLINAFHIKNVPGKKTDYLDCQWIQQLHSYGLLKGSFRPVEEICKFRAFTRHREMLVESRSIHIQHMQKNLELMNLKLVNVLKDITGKTGMNIIRSIVAGKRNSLELARFRDPRCKSSVETIAKSLVGHYKEEYLFGLQQALSLYDTYTSKIKECDEQIMQSIEASSYYKNNNDLDPLPKKRLRSSKKCRPHYDLRSYLYQLSGVDLTAIDGIDVLTAQIVISEVGLDMSKWPTEKHFASWLGLCPINFITGGKVIKRGSKKTKNPAMLAIRRAVRGLYQSKSALGAFYRRLKAKHGPSKANKATAHKIARIIYNILKDKKPYEDIGEEHYLKKYKGRILKNLKYRAEKMGFELIPVKAVLKTA